MNYPEAPIPVLFFIHRKLLVWQSYGLGNWEKTMLAISCLLIALYLIAQSRRRRAHGEESKRRKLAMMLKQKARQVRALGDEILHDRRLRPALRKVRRAAAVTMGAMKKKRKHPFGVGDGLASIFASTQYPLPPLGDGSAKSQKEQEIDRLAQAGGRQFPLDQPQRAALQALGQLRVFGANEAPFLLALCKDAELVTLPAGHMVWEEGQPLPTVINVLWEGRVETSTAQEHRKEVLGENGEKGSILLSMVDLLAMIIGQDTTCPVSIQCKEPSTFIQLNAHKHFEIMRQTLKNGENIAMGYGNPRPSTSHGYTQLIKTILTRINRVTMMTVYLYLDLIEDIEPPVFISSLPQGFSAKTEGKEEPAHLADLDLVAEAVAAAFGSSVLDILPLVQLEPFREWPVDDHDGLHEGDHGSISQIVPGSLPRASSLYSSGFEASLPELGRKSSVSDTGLDESEASPLPQGTHLQLPKGARRILVRRVAPCARLVPPPGGACYLVLRGELWRRRASPTNLEAATAAGGVVERNKGVVGEGTTNKGLCLPGSVIGELSLFTATSEWYGGGAAPSLLTLSTGTDGAWVAQIPAATHAALLRRSPAMAVALARKVIQRLPGLLRVFDLGAHWLALEPGQDLSLPTTAASVGGASADPFCDGLHVVLHGRLRLTPLSTEDKRGKTSEGQHSSRPDQQQQAWAPPLREYGRGHVLGPGIASTLSPGTVLRAARPSALAKIPGAYLAHTVRKHPRVLGVLTTAAAAATTLGGQPGSFQSMNMVAGGTAAAAQPDAASPKNIFVVPISPSVPLERFCQRLAAALQEVTGVGSRVVSSAAVASRFGAEEEDAQDELFASPDLALGAYLQQLEEQPGAVLFQADWSGMTSWNRLCSRQADRLLLVANAADAPRLGALEQALDPGGLRHAPSELVLLHVDPPPGHRPAGTRAWVLQRRGVALHHHLRYVSGEGTAAARASRRDLGRLARRLAGRAVGLALGGGGARGMAHLGVLRALEEEGVPVDYVGGTSMGALVAAVYSRHGGSYLKAKGPLLRFAAAMASKWNYAADLTFPLLSWFSGRFFNRAVGQALGGSTKIEDLWLNFFCVTTDLGVARERVHRNGTAWGYVRASMSLAGYLPPMCDTDAATGRVHYLMDGAYVNNIPADLVAREFRPRHVIAVNVNAHFELNGGEDYGPSLSGFRLLWERLRPWGRRRALPDFANLSDHLTYLSYTRRWEDTCASGVVDLLLEPPVKAYGILDYHRAAEIERLAYEDALPAVRAWKRKSALLAAAAAAAGGDGGGGGGAGASSRGEKDGVAGRSSSIG